MTLMELMIASILGIVILIGMAQVDVTRIYLSQQINRSSGSHSEAMMTLSHMVKTLQQADRAILDDTCTSAKSAVTGVCLRVRVPVVDLNSGTPPNLDQASSYRWDEYRYVDTDNDAKPDAVRYYMNIAAGCSTRMIFSGLTGFTMRFKDESIAPPGGPGREPFAPTGEDNNLLEVVATTSAKNPQNPLARPIDNTYTIEAALRATGYTNVPEGLAPPGINDPPTRACP